MVWLLKPNQQDQRNLAANSTILTIHMFGYNYVLSLVTFVVVVNGNKMTTIKGVFVVGFFYANNNNQGLKVCCSRKLFPKVCFFLLFLLLKNTTTKSKLCKQLQFSFLLAKISSDTNIRQYLDKYCNCGQKFFTKVLPAADFC